MSIQVSRVKGFGYKFDYKENLFSHIDNSDDEYEFLEVIGLNYSYYEIKEDKRKSLNLKVVTDRMSGEYVYVLYLEEVSYIENSHGDEYWCNKYRYDDWVKKYAKEHIETFLGRKLGEPQEFDFKHYQ